VTIDPLDLIRSLAGVTNINAGPSWKRNAKRLVDICWKACAHAIEERRQGCDRLANQVRSLNPD